MTGKSRSPRLRASPLGKVAVAATIGAMFVIGLISWRNDPDVERR